MEEEKRCYSLNQAAYLIYLGYTYEIKFDEESVKFYIVFPESSQIKKDIYDYKATDVAVSLKGFTSAYKALRKEINCIRDSKEFRMKYAFLKMRVLFNKANEGYKEKFKNREEFETYIEDCKHLSQEALDEKYFNNERVDYNE